MATPRQVFGRWGEDQAARFLTGKGYLILAHNVRTSYGEIDLIARQDTGHGPGEPDPGGPEGEGTIVFVEVKTRSSDAFGLPEEAVTARKQAHLYAAAQSYLQEHPELDGPWRIDVVAIQRSRRGRAATIVHFEDALR